VVGIANRHRAVVTVEENAIMGGAGSAVGEALSVAGIQIPLLHLGIPDRFIEHGSRDSCLASAGLDLNGLSNSIDAWWAMLNQTRLRSIKSV